MLLQAKNKKGVSIMVGYVLLVVFAIILSLIAYQWIKTYVPSDSLQCPDSGVSVSIKALYYDCEGGNNNLYLNVKNSGRFSILGYFAHAANVSGQEVATIDLSQYFNETLSGGQRFGNSIAFISAEENLFKPGDEKVAIFNLTDVGVLTSIQITPTRMQEVDNKNRFISCGNEIVKQDIYCGMDTRIVDVVCVPDCEGGVRICGSDGCTDDGCGTCPGGESCDALGQCYSDSCTPASDPCGTRECGFALNGTAPTDCGSVPCGVCIGDGEWCDAGQCTTIGNNACDPGETCAEEPVACEGQQAECVDPGETCQSGSCVFNTEGSFNSCGDYCALFGYSQMYSCQDNPNKCAPPQGPEGGIYIGDVEGANETYGNSFCLGDPYCCCQP